MAKIMVVDDAVFMRQTIIKILTGEGYEICTEASTAKEAIEKYKKYKPDLVTMDIVMPMVEEMDGIGAIREIIKFDPVANIVVVSVLGQKSLIFEAINSGARDFIPKPVVPSRLISAARNILGYRKV